MSSPMNPRTNLLISALPLVGELTIDLADGKLDDVERERLIEHAGPLLQALTGLLIAAAVRPPAPTPAPAPAPPPTVPAPAPPVVVAPPAPARKLRIVKGTAHVTGVYDRNNVGAGDAALAALLRGDNMDNGYILHTDSEWTLEDGSVLRPGDPRWKDVNRWAPNGNAIFPYYEYNGALTAIWAGDKGSEFVDPFSFEDDEGCTVSFRVETPAPHNTQATFRFGYAHKNEDGEWVRTGLIGQGNLPEGVAFKVR